ncbi:MAG: acyltransferase family protein [Chloroflexi bacterium]|nr:acyltransferase family protein [Chloroflexota bacterium]
MQKTINLQSAPAMEGVRATVQAASRAGARLVYVDRLRVILIALVVMLHAAVTYGSVGDWTFVEEGSDEVTDLLLLLFVINCQAFFMGLFFFVAGYFIPGSVDRKGLVTFWKDRLLRLAVPFLVFSLFLAKISIYLDEIRHEGLTLSFWEFGRQYFWQTLDAGPLWFVFALLVFSAGYSLWRLAGRRGHNAHDAPAVPVPGHLALLGFALAMGVMTFAASQVSPIGYEDKLFGFISMQWAFFPQYILMFVAGIVAYRSDWLARMSPALLRVWRWVALALLVALPLIMGLGGEAEDAFLTGLHWQALALSLWMGLACVSYSLTLTLWLRERHNRPGTLQAGLAASAFTVYIIHSPVLVSITYALSFVALHPLVKFGLASVMAVSASFALAHVLRKLPGAKAIL